MQIGNVIFKNPKTWSDTLIYLKCSDGTGFQGLSLNSLAKAASLWLDELFYRWDDHSPQKNVTFDPGTWFSLRWGFEQLICFSWPSCWDHYSHCLQEIRQKLQQGLRVCWGTWDDHVGEIRILVNLHHRRSCHISKYPSWYFLQKGVINQHFHFNK